MTKQSGRDRYLTLSEIHQMIFAAQPGRDRMLVTLLAHTGGRIGEVIRVRCCDLLQEDQAIRLANLKRKAGQIGTKLVGVRQEIVNTFVDYCITNRLEGTDYLFDGRVSGRPLSQRQARTIVYQAAIAAGIERIRLRSPSMGPVWPHLFRHSLATLWLKENVQLPIIARQLGHSQIRNTMEYLSVSVGDQRSAAERVAL